MLIPQFSCRLWVEPKKKRCFVVLWVTVLVKTTVGLQIFVETNMFGMYYVALYMP